MRYTKSDLIKIKNMIEIIRDKELYSEELAKKFFGEKDFIYLCKYFKYLEEKDKINDLIKEAEYIINETPYMILDIEEKHYTKEELMTIIEERINRINKIVTDKNTKEKQIDNILDAYNFIVNQRKIK